MNPYRQQSQSMYGGAQGAYRKAQAGGPSDAARQRAKRNAEMMRMLAAGAPIAGTAIGAGIGAAAGGGLPGAAAGAGIGGALGGAASGLFESMAGAQEAPMQEADAKRQARLDLYRELMMAAR